MPWRIENDNPECSGWAVVKESDGSIAGCHETEEKAKAQLAALYASESDDAEPAGESRVRPPRDNLVRALASGFEIEGRTIVGRLAPANQWAEINSAYEGHFLERHAPGAFGKTFRENRDRIRILFQHGKDPELGMRPIAEPLELAEDAQGAYYRGELLDGIPPMILDGLKRGQYGSSHTFRVVREDWEPKPKGGAHNPGKLPERTILEAHVFELGPVTWPAYAGASAGVRSMTDEYALDRLAADPDRLREMVTATTTANTLTVPAAPSLDAGEQPHLEPERRAEPEPSRAVKTEEITVPTDTKAYPTRDEKVARVGEIERELETIDKQFDGKLPDEPQARWDALVAEKHTHIEDIEAIDARKRELRDRRVGVPTDLQTEPGYEPAPFHVVKQRDLASIYDISRIHRESRNEAHFAQNIRDNAMRSVEGAAFANPHFPRQTGQTDVAALLDGKDECDPVEVAKRVLYTGSPAYRRAFRKKLLDQTMLPEEAAAFDEARAALVTLSNVAVPYDLDSTMQINTAGAVNPYREAFRVIKTTSNDWRPMVSSGMTAVYVGEATAPSEGAPAFTAPARLVQKAHTVATFSTEIQSDYPGLEAELAREISDAKDVLESVQFTTGAGTTIYPQGIFTYFTANFLDTATTLVIVPKDLYALEANIGPRYRGNTVWLGSPYFYSLVRSIDTAGGAGLWVDNLRLGGAVGTAENNGRLGSLLGHPAYEVGGLPDGTMATTEKVAILAHRERFVIIDRIGMNLELIPNFLDVSSGLPTGQRMVYAWWRNTSCGIGLATLGAGRAACIFRGK